MTTAGRRLLWGAIAALLVFLGIPLLQVVTAILDPEEPAAVPAVSSVAIEYRTLRERLRYPGTLRAERHTAVLPKLAGRVEHVHVRENELVERDDILVSIDDRTVQLEMRQAEAARNAAAAELRRARRGARRQELESARATVAQAEEDLRVAENAFERARSLFADDVISRSEFEQTENEVARAHTAVENARRELTMLEDGATEEEIEALEANLQAAENRWELARLRAGDARVTAPVSGTVAELPVAVGDTVDTATAVAILVGDQRIKLELPVPERHYGRFIQLDRSGAAIAVAVVPSALGDDIEYHGQVSRVGRTVTPESGAFMIEALIDNPLGELRGGMFVNAYVIVREAADALTVPRTAVVRRRGQAVVFLFEPGHDSESDESHGTAHMVEVEPGIEQDGMVELRGGLGAWEHQDDLEVIVRGNAFLEDGQTVRRVAQGGANGS